MNLRKTIILSAILAAGSTAFAQSSNVKKAASNIQEYEKFRAAGTPQLGEKFLNLAKDAIDLAIVNDKTKDNADTWTYYSLIYSNLAVDKKSTEDAKKAEEGIKTAKSLDKDAKNKENIGVAEQTLYAYNFNQGVAFWEASDFNNAYNSFDQALVYAPGDTTLTYYAALAAIQSSDYPKGIEKYKQLLDKRDYSQHKTVVVDLPKLFLSVKDTTAALEYAALAAKEYPNDNNAITQNIELNLIAGNESKIIADIQSQITKDSGNKTLYYYLGLAQSASGKTKDAYEAYKKAIAIDPNYTDANLNAAVTLINSTRDDIQLLNEDKNLTNTQYAAKIEALKEQIKPAENYFAAVLSIEPKNEMALKGLKSLYDFLQLEEKSQEIQARIDAI
ncbi:tetratricopeptide repeat protein [Sphingobacterium rhinopitheci]|uniref:tetratricopeptide repeat protein n=1 Tax=Sphingobacterium rhinopitheci TaxID=2781960 RepID=UPI001F523C35|nr:tetratricopeptide repeat protein [Sphingobacterium rhinopitheci]MCI0922267.1 tetratricopeptide repeat protein [Sphingobacterium rhinopitheci]